MTGGWSKVLVLVLHGPAAPSRREIFFVSGIFRAPVLAQVPRFDRAFNGQGVDRRFHRPICFLHAPGGGQISGTFRIRDRWPATQIFSQVFTEFFLEGSGGGVEKSGGTHSGPASGLHTQHCEIENEKPKGKQLGRFVAKFTRGGSVDRGDI